MIPGCIKLGIYDRAIVARLIDESARLRCRPEQLALALISCAIEMPDAVLDGAEPAELHPHAMPQAKTAGLTVKQHALLALMASRSGADGLARLSASAAAEMLGIGDYGPVVARFQALVRMGCLAIVERGSRRSATLYRVTQHGHAALARWAAS